MQNTTDFVMSTIRAAHNLTIEFDLTTWRLVNGSRLPDHPETALALVEAHATEIICLPAFAHARQLYAERLAPPDVARVVVGWAAETRNWHLGLLMAARPETGYKTQWCSLAIWPSSAASDFAEPARQAGQSLAQLINRPFFLVPPPSEQRTRLTEETIPLMPTRRLEPAAIELPTPQIELRQPPFEFENTQMLSVPRGYVWQKRAQWIVAAGGRAIGLLVLAGAFLVLGFGTETADLAAVNPGWLPFLGMVVAVLLFGLSLQTFGQFLNVTDVILDTTMQEVRCQNRLLGRVRWRLPFESVEYVLLSHTPAQPQGRKGSDGSMKIALEGWLHLYDGEKFWPVAELGRVEGASMDWTNVRASQKKRGRRPISLTEYDTPAHHAALRTARIIHTEIWLDIR
ncbi:MAG: hypothetical protein HY866_03275 [Chloroflexi bacterium]|nr:hypothetical protein [Chloroflexota bacterium]